MWKVSGFGFFFSSRRRHTRCSRDWSSDVCSSDLLVNPEAALTADHELLRGLEGLVLQGFANPTHQGDGLELRKQGGAFGILYGNRKAVRLAFDRHHIEEIPVPVVRKSGLVVAADNRLKVVTHSPEENGKNYSTRSTSITRSSLSTSRKRSEEHTSELQSRLHLVCRLLLENKR